MRKKIFRLISDIFYHVGMYETSIRFLMFSAREDIKNLYSKMDKKCHSDNRHCVVFEDKGLINELDKKYIIHMVRCVEDIN